MSSSQSLPGGLVEVETGVGPRRSYSDAATPSRGLGCHWMHFITRRRVVVFGVYSAVIIALSVMGRGASWISSSGLHTVMSAVATTLAVAIGVLATVRFHSRRRSKYLYLGVGFLTTGILDAYHTVATSRVFVPSPELVAWSGSFSRLFLGVFIGISWVVWRRERGQMIPDEKNPAWVYLPAMIVALIAIAVFAWFPLPSPYVESSIFPRPWELITGGVFALSLVGYVVKRQWRYDAFEFWLIMSLVTSVVGQVEIAQSRQPFDSKFDIANGFLITGYGCVFVGLLVSFYHLLRQFEMTAHELARANEDLESANSIAQAATRSKSEFLANMSHEIRTPMTAVLGFAEELRNPGLGAEERDEIVQTIHGSAQHLLNIVNDILDLSKIEARKLDVRCDPCCLFEITETVRGLMSSRAREKGLTFSLEYATSVPETITTDSTRLRQILINLVGNAIKFADSGSIVILISHSRDEVDMVHFVVVDSGIGMTKEQLSRVFEPFTQADGSTTRIYGGTGLGLSVARQLSRLLGGGISAHSEPGRGSAFRVSIPTGSLQGVTFRERPPEHFVVDEATGECKETAAPEVEESETASDVPLRVLVAEDNPVNQKLIRRIIERAGIDLHVVSNGQEAVDELEEAEDRYDVVLMDMQMPVLDGYGATRALRTRGCTIPIIALTANAMTGDREKCLDAGCDDYTTKPIDRKVLVEKIGELAARERSR
ncbi:MAG: ATP-binding protein [Planctomycetota bacterium]